MEKETDITGKVSVSYIDLNKGILIFLTEKWVYAINIMNKLILRY